MNIQITCPSCGSQLTVDSEKEFFFCSNCGTRIAKAPQPQQITPNQNKPPINNSQFQPQPVPQQRAKRPWYKKWWIWVIAGVVLTAIIGIVFGQRDNGSKDFDDFKQIEATGGQKSEEKKEETKADTSETTEAANELSAEDIIDRLTKQGYEEVSPSVLYNHPDKYEGQKIVTAALISNTSSDYLYSDIDNEKILNSLCFKCKSMADTMNAKEGDYVIVYGTGDGKSLVGSYRDFKDCRVASVGDQAKIEYDKLVLEASDKENKIKEENAKKEAEDKQTYIDSCATIDYTTLSRNPDKYKGNHYKFTGQVIQVLESDSWFDDATTLRVNVTKSDNEYLENFWEDTIICTVNIPKGSDRILEDDIITFYGDCDGLYTYTALLGQKVSLPKIDIKYYSINQ